MKKILFILFLLLVPFIVKAEVKIADAVLVDNTEGLEVENIYHQVRVISCHFEPDDETYNSVHRVYRDDLFKVRKDMTINSVRNHPEDVLKLNPNAPDISINDVDYFDIYPKAYYSCTKRVPIVEWKPNMTPEEKNEYNAYRRNLNTCYEELTDEDWNTIPQGYNYDSPLLSQDQAAYFVNACPEIK